MSPASENLNDIESAANAYRNVRKVLVRSCAVHHRCRRKTNIADDVVANDNKTLVMRFVVAIALLQAMGWVPTAYAAANQDGAKAEADKDAARTEWRRGTTAYDLGHYEEAAAHFEAAYTLVQDPGVLFNIAQCYRMGGKLNQALERYRAFLRNASAGAPNRNTAEKFAEEIKHKLGENKETGPIAPPETAPSKEPAPAGLPTTPAVPLAETPAAVSIDAAPAPATPIAVPVPPLLDNTTALTSAPVAPEQTSIVQPIYKKWLFWTGVGAVVAAGTVTALLLTHRSSSPCSGTGPNCWEVK